MQEKVPNAFYGPIQYSDAVSFYTKKEVNIDDIGSPWRDACVIRTAPMDKEGYFNFGMHNTHTLHQLMYAPLAIVEVNPNIPVALGGVRSAFIFLKLIALLKMIRPCSARILLKLRKWIAGLLLMFWSIFGMAVVFSLVSVLCLMLWAI